MKNIILLTSIILLFGCTTPNEYKQLADYCKSINGNPSPVIFEVVANKELFITCQKEKKELEIIIKNGQPTINQNPYLEIFEEPSLSAEAINSSK